MDQSLAWALAGIALVIIELLSGTFYLLMLGIAAFGAAIAAWLGQPFSVQVIVAAVVAGVGAYMVHAYRARNVAQQMPSIDAGQPANFESWIDREARLARVRYRGASWDARFDDEDLGVEPGAVLYVLQNEGNTLRVTTRRRA
jgi:membrane protein implicated in regulation of membrane protease activity